MTVDHLGPTGFAAVQFEDAAAASEGLRAVRELAEAGPIVVLDLEFLVRDADGAVHPVAADALPGAGADLAGLAGADSHLLDDDDVRLVAADLPVGKVLSVLVYEDRSFVPTIERWERSGATLVAEGPVSPDDLQAALSDGSAEEA
jgi:hypothetical protein